MRGGARVRSGPGADPQALRRDRDGLEFVTLPLERTGDTPAWPIAPQPTRAEASAWDAHWRLPQAVEWERLRLEVQLAIYIRTLGEASRRGANAAIRAEQRRQADALGLTANGMKSLRWILPAAAAQTFEATGTETPRPAKERFRVVPGGR